jgi:flagellar protein FlgJ
MDALGSLAAPTVVGSQGSQLGVPHGKRNDPAAIDKVANGFETMFLSMLLKEMRQTLEAGSMFAEDTGDVLGGLFDMFMSQHLAKQAPLGIGQMVRRQLSTGHTTPPGKET